MLKPVDDVASAAWRAAAEDLAIRVEAPWVLAGSRGGAETYVAFVPDFGSPRGMAVRSLPTTTDNRPVAFSGTVVYLAVDTYGRYDRHEWIDLLEQARWFSPDPPPAWYTAVSPWHRDTAVLRTVGDELERIFGHPVSVIDSAPYRELDLLPGTEVLAFLARVPAGGVTPQSLGRWAHDVATQWQASHPRRQSNER
jgi:hypothetical protein